MYIYTHTSYSSRVTCRRKRREVKNQRELIKRVGNLIVNEAFESSANQVGRRRNSRGVQDEIKLPARRPALGYKFSITLSFRFSVFSFLFFFFFFRLFSSNLWKWRWLVRLFEIYETGCHAKPFVLEPPRRENNWFNKLAVSLKQMLSNCFASQGCSLATIELPACWISNETLFTSVVLVSKGRGSPSALSETTLRKRKKRKSSECPEFQECPLSKEEQKMKIQRSLPFHTVETLATVSPSPSFFYFLSFLCSSSRGLALSAG